MNSKRELGTVKRLVIKIGSATVMGLDVERLAKTLALLMADGLEIVLVSSGAVSMGMQVTGTSIRPRSMPRLQALASLGQVALMGRYQSHFSTQGLQVAQVLLTHQSLAQRDHFLNIRHTLKEVSKMGALAIVNENDTVATEELRFGDNDLLAGALASVVDADLVILLSDVDALYDADPNTHVGASRVGLIELEDPLLDSITSSSSSRYGTGGMASKVAAARLCCEGGIGLVVASGKDPGILRDIVTGRDVGTYFVPRRERVDRRRQWIGFLSKTCGQLRVDDGAVRALTREGSSLLAVGIEGVSGEFKCGDAVQILDSEGREVGKGLVRYNSEELELRRGLNSQAITERLGAVSVDPVIHRNDLLLS